MELLIVVPDSPLFGLSRSLVNQVGQPLFDCKRRGEPHTMEVNMPGASEKTRRVKILNANWISSIDDGSGRFELLIITEDDQQFAVPADPVSMTALVALARADTVLAWDPTDRTLIVANIVGTMPWTAAPAV